MRRLLGSLRFFFDKKAHFAHCGVCLFGFCNKKTPAKWRALEDVVLFFFVWYFCDFNFLTDFVLSLLEEGCFWTIWVKTRWIAWIIGVAI